MGGALHPLRGNCIARLIRPLPAGALAPAGGWQPRDGVIAVSGWHHKAQQLRRQVILRLRQRQLRTDTIRSNRATSEYCCSMFLVTTRCLSHPQKLCLMQICQHRGGNSCYR